MGLKVWLELLSGKAKEVSANRVGLVIVTSMISLINTFINSVAGIWESCIGLESLDMSDYESPIFIIGHWRSGTTLLHELLSCIDELKAPTTYQCFCPRHFLLSERVATSLLRWMLPTNRGIDNIRISWDSPQEDEFALLMMGAKTPYSRIAFPSLGDQLCGLDINELPRDNREYWGQTLLIFIKRLMIRDKRRLILKSPSHTARISSLVSLFPGAKFIFVSRNPMDMIPSAIKLWKYLDLVHGLNSKGLTDYKKYSLTLFSNVETAYLRDKELLSNKELVEIKFEDLISNPTKTLEKIIHQLGLDRLHVDHEALKSVLERISEEIPEKYKLEDDERQYIANATSSYCERYGYAP